MQLTPDKLHRAIQDIADNAAIPQNLSYGLLTGISGITIFHAYAHKYSIAAHSATALQETFDLGLEGFFSATDPDTSFGYGLAGYIWHLKELARMELIELDAALTGIIQASRQRIIASVLTDLQNDHIDFFTGALGKIISLFPFSGEESIIVKKFIDYLSRHLCGDDSGFYSLAYRDGYSSRGTYANMGLAHGIPGIVHCCTLCRKSNLFTNEIDAIAHCCFDFLLRNINEDTSACYYPAFLQKDAGQTPGKSRLAWCYGDLSLAYTLLLSGNAFQNHAIRDLAMKILRQCAGRRTPEDSQIVDAGICHGSAGVAHLFHKAWLVSREPVLYDAAAHWIGRTLAFAQTEDGMTVYKRFDAANSLFHTEHNLLTGMAGIGLVLGSWLTGDCSWDTCFLLQEFSD